MTFLDLQIPFFRPLWRRLVLIALCWGWACVEFWNDATVWGALFVLIGGLAVWQFFIKPWPEDPDA